MKWNGQKWEYHIIASLPEGLAGANRDLDEIGDLGFELVGIDPQGRLIFKRPLVD